MAAFDKVLSGMDSLDKMLDYIRMGDNVVWQVSDVAEFSGFARKFAKQAIRDKRNLIYIRFSQGEPILEPMEGLKIYEFSPENGFESFTVAIHNRIREEGRDAFYVFDSLSELQSAWYTDLMMGNFFRVTCPYLFELDTVAFFPLIRGRHSYDTIAKIRETTQILMEVYSDKENFYVQPLKVWNRYSEKMFITHVTKKYEDCFRTLNSGVAVSKYYRIIENLSENETDQNMDSYDRFFVLAQSESKKGVFTSETEDMIISSIMTKDGRLKELIKEYFKPEDYFRIRKRTVGSGAIGGKSCGMLLARRIIKTKLPEEHDQYSEPHDSWYIGSDVFYTYIVHNKCWKLRIKQRTEEGFFQEAPKLQTALLTGEFPSDIKDKFRHLLEYYGQNPIIVRSSSFLEDGFGNAFAGKYESVFCANQGDMDERLDVFEKAIKQVYASTMDVSALEYRRQRGLEQRDEQMAILVQRLSGTFFDHYFMPCTAGVGFSHSSYKWRPDMDAAAGMLRIVAGFGTKAVDRTEYDYPRLVSLDYPTTTTLTNVADKHKYSQRKLDVIDLDVNDMVEKDLEDLLPYMPLWYKKEVLDRDYEAERTLRDMGRNRDVWFISCQKLLENKAFTSYMQSILKTLESVYGNPVDIEYAVNLDEDENFVVNLLQCRPLYSGKTGGHVAFPEVSEDHIFFEVRNSSMGSTQVSKIDAVVQIHAKEYYEYPHREKNKVADIVGKINQYFKESGGKVLLLTPGRIGTSSPELGVPVRFAQISGFCGVCEVSDRNNGHIPDLSYGSHMFQDLVEAEIMYSAILNDNTTIHFQANMFLNEKNLFLDICPEEKGFETMFTITKQEDLYYYLDAVENHAIVAQINS